MKMSDFLDLKDVVYEFTTYMDEKIVGIPLREFDPKTKHCYIIPFSKIREYNDATISLESRILLGLVLEINLDVIDDVSKLENL